MAIVTTTQALKKLYKAVVGEDTEKNNPTKIISDLADNYSGGGGSSIVHPVQVTITNNTEDTLSLSPLISNDDPESGYSGGFYISDTGITQVNSSTEWLPSLLKDTTTDLPLAYCLDDGVIYIKDIMGEHYTYTLSENATKTEIQGLDVIVVTGDCTITIS